MVLASKVKRSLPIELLTVLPDLLYKVKVTVETPPAKTVYSLNALPSTVKLAAVSKPFPTSATPVLLELKACNLILTSASGLQVVKSKT